MTAARILKRLLLERGLTHEEAAAQLGVGRSVISNLVRECKITPGLPLAARIETWSKGKIPASLWMKRKQSRAA